MPPASPFRKNAPRRSPFGNCFHAPQIPAASSGEFRCIKVGYSCLCGRVAAVNETAKPASGRKSPNLERHVPTPEYQFINTQSQLDQFVTQYALSPQVALDTEFVSEDSYRPELCLVQVAVEGRIFLIDPLAPLDLQRFWDWLVEGKRRTIVHSGREELRFCWQATGRFPQDVFDVQLAAALIGFPYPASYATLVATLLGEQLSKGETRSDWRRRPLGKRQSEYAAQDVAYLEPLARELAGRLQATGRMGWLAEEVATQQQVIRQQEEEQAWWRLPLLDRLTRRGLAIARNLWLWREAEAARRNIPPRWLLRDDLIVELARRQSADPRHIQSLRGMEKKHLARCIPEIAREVQKALELDESDLPDKPVRRNRPKLTVSGQLLSAVLGSICHQVGVAASLVATTDDVREWIAYRLDLPGAPKTAPRLARGWRAEVIGRKFEDILAGRLCLRIRDPASDQPLEWLPCPEPITGATCSTDHSGSDAPSAPTPANADPPVEPRSG
ncbi:MAG: ribonuclease D [Pirellulaceae bacterium]|nr:MAG: ribonuclease D [Pirellulaceae bacterium]